MPVRCWIPVSMNNIGHTVTIKVAEEAFNYLRLSWIVCAYEEDCCLIHASELLLLSAR